MKNRNIILTTITLLALGCFGLLPAMQGVNPPPDGGYPGLNTAEGDWSLSSLTGGGWNTALGGYTLYSDSTGGANTAVGLNALRQNHTGSFNTAVGLNALYSNQAPENSAFGAYALFANTSATRNSAFGWGALALNTTGADNTAVGDSALIVNAVGARNTAVGSSALYGYYSGLPNANSDNTAIGYGALSQDVDFVGNGQASGNTAIGSQALYAGTAAPLNTAVGFQALYHNQLGSRNTGIGAQAMFNTTSLDIEFANENTAVGFQALYGNTVGTDNVALGSGAGRNLTTGNRNIDIGNDGVAAESNTIRIGTAGIQTATYMAGIFGATVTDGVGVIIDVNGHLGTAVSSARFKTEIKPMDNASEAILSFKPVTFRYKSSKTDTPQFGLIAEEVAKVNPDLVVRDKNGETYTVRYDAVNAMLLNEFLKEHRKVEKLEAALEAVNRRLKEQDAKIQKASARLELSNPSPRTVLNDQ